MYTKEVKAGQVYLENIFCHIFKEKSPEIKQEVTFIFISTRISILIHTFLDYVTQQYETGNCIFFFLRFGRLEE